MNTIRSTGYGWGVLIVAGAGAYYFAKRSINEERAERQEKELRRRMLTQRMEARERVENRPKSTAYSEVADHASSLSSEASQNSVSVDHAQRRSAVERGKYAPAEPFRSKKGDRFS